MKRSDLRRVAYLDYTENNREKNGYFHQWISEFSTDGTSSIYAIVEDFETGKIKRVYYTNITFHE